MQRLLASASVAAVLFSSAPAALALMPSAPSLVVTVHGPSVPQSVAPGSQGVPMLELEMKNETKEDATVSELRILRRGLGDRLDIEGIYLRDENGARLSDRFSIARDGVVDVRIWPPLEIPSGDTITVHVVADFAREAAISGEHRLWLSSNADVDAGDTPVIVTQGTSVGGIVRTAGATRGSVDVDYPGLNERVRYGENRLIGRLRLTATGKDDQLVSSITLTNDGKARGDDLRNISIESSRNVRLTDVASQLGGRTKDTVTLTFKQPLRIGGGSSVMLNVRADALASRRRTIDLIVEEPGDVHATTSGR